MDSINSIEMKYCEQRLKWKWFWKILVERRILIAVGQTCVQVQDSTFGLMTVSFKHFSNDVLATSNPKSVWYCNIQSKSESSPSAWTRGYDFVRASLHRRLDTRAKCRCLKTDTLKVTTVGAARNDQTAIAPSNNQVIKNPHPYPSSSLVCRFAGSTPMLIQHTTTNIHYHLELVITTANY